MFVLKKIAPLPNKGFTRLMRTAISMRNTLQPKTVSKKKIIIEPLSEREIVRVQGSEVVPFMQGLITNDMKQFEKSSSLSMYTMFLNKAGRVLYDTIIYRTSVPDTFFIECDKYGSSELRRHLRLYRVRRKIDIDSAVNEFRPWIVYTSNNEKINSFDAAKMAPELFSTPDPRLRELGVRIVTTADMTWNDVARAFINEPDKVKFGRATETCNYKLHRYRHGIGEGVNELPPGKCFPLEANGDFLHGISFNKGCYIGQELTARVFHTGVVRKRLMPLRLTKPIRSTSVQSMAGASVGSVRDTCYDHALALLRIDQALSQQQLVIDGEPCYAEKPVWWPRELPNKAVIR